MKKRIMSLLMTLVMMWSLVPTNVLAVEEIVTSGMCGDNISWEFDESTGTLTICGNPDPLEWGPMWDYNDSHSVMPSTSSFPPWYDYKELIQNVVVTEGVSRIGDYSFYGCGNLVTADLCDDLNSIGDYAFSGCSSLTEIEIPDSVSYTEFGIINGCSKLTSINIPKNLTRICIPLASNCESLTTITVSEENPSYSNDENGVLFNKEKTALLCYPSGKTETEYIIPDCITTLGESAFEGNIHLKKIVLPDSLIVIEQEAFRECSKLQEVNIPNGVSTIEYCTFGFCENLQNIEIPESVSTIEDSAFSCCNSLTSIKIPEGTTRMGHGAFTNCEGLKEVTLPESMVSIGDYCFNGCISLTSINVPDGVVSLGEWVFANCQSLKRLVIPNGVYEIGEYCFGGCESLMEIDMPEALINIGEEAFYRCVGLKNIMIPAGVRKIGEEAFGGCISLESFIVSEENQFYKSDEFGVLFDKTGETLLQYPVGSLLEEYNIPDGTIELSSSAFIYGANLKHVAIPIGVTTIAENCFADCGGLLSIEIPDGVTTIESGAFMLCRKMQSIKIPESLKKIESSAFVYCSSLSKVYYAGSEEQWEAIEIGEFNDWLTKLTPVFEYNGEIEEPIHDYRMVLSHAGEELTVTTGETVEIVCSLYDGDTLVTDWDEPSTAYGNVDCIEYGKWEKCDKGYKISIKGVKSGVASLTVQLPDTDVTATTEIEVVALSNDAEGLVVFSDYTNNSISIDSTITLSAGLMIEGKADADVSGIGFNVSDSSILSVSSTGVENNRRYVKLKGLKEGVASVIFTDSLTGDTAKVTVTVYKNNYHSYSLSNVPTKYIEKYPTNIYNVNGLYVDNYSYSVNEDQSATVKFDVYNTNYYYGAVEVYNENGNVVDAVLINKMQSSATNLKSAFWDNINFLIRDIADGDILTYRQESGFSKKTEISVKIPKNGYLKINMNPMQSFIVGFVNAADFLMSMASLSGDIANYDVNGEYFTKELTLKLVKDKIYADYLVDGCKMPEKLWKNVRKATFASQEGMGSFADTLAHNIDELNLEKIIADTAVDFGWDIGEKAAVFFFGPAGTALKAMFTIGKAEDVVIQYVDLLQAEDVGCILLQNQGGGIRSVQQIKVESKNDFAQDVSLNIYADNIDPIALNAIKLTDPELYMTLTKGKVYTYNISLVRDGEEVQPESEVIVYIPIPEEFKALAYLGKVKIYRQENDGVMTEMDVEIEDGCFVFATNHFSVYAIVAYDENITNPFSDVKDSDWFYDSVMWAYENNVTGGTSATTFGPNDSCTRAQVVTFLYAAAGKPPIKTTDNPFTDVKESDWYYQPVLWAVENGITGGVSADKFGPNQTCTRAQIVTFLYAAAGKPAVSGNSDFKDVADTDWFATPVIWAAQNEVTGGIGDGKFGPNNTCTRGQVVTFLFKVYGNK